MAGFPFFQLDKFLKILAQDLNKYVAISEEFPTSLTGKVKSGGLLFDRRVACIVTPGPLINEKFIGPYENNFLLALDVSGRNPVTVTKLPLERGSHDQFSISPGSVVGLAWLDHSTGDFFTQITTAALLPSAITRVGAREVILDHNLPHCFKHGIQALVGEDRYLITFHDCSAEFVSMSEWNEMTYYLGFR
jgi:DNA mismatch repair ATPase MutS